MLKVEWA